MAATRLLPTIIGPELAARMLFTGEVILGSEAQRIGLVSKSVPAADVMKEAMLLAESIAEKVTALCMTCWCVNVSRECWLAVNAHCKRQL